jgi:hypothetical protein
VSDDRDAELPITWGLFVKLETASQTVPEGELADVSEFYDVAVAEIGEEGLLRGWALAAAVLREHLREHAVRLGCDCASDDWLRREQLHHAR